MPDAYTFITDTPTLLDAGEGAPITSRIQVAEIGRFKDPRYGSFAIAPSDVANWKRLLAGHFQGRVPIDFDHRTDKGISSEAAGWITSLQQTGNQVHANVEWTPPGESAVREKRYLYISPTFVDTLKDQTGTALGPALLRAALTNNPFLRNMPAVSLSADSFTVAERIAEPPDSRPVMPELSKIAKALSLPQDATEEKILEAIGERAEPPQAKTLEAQAAEKGMVLLDAERVTKLEADAATGVQAAKQLGEQRFTLAFDKALTDGRVDAKPETRELHQSIYDANPDLAIRNLEALPKVVNLAAATTTGRVQADGEAPEGVDPDSFELDQRVQAHMAEHKTDYMTALEAVA
jgi:hypothetical protein